MRITLKERFLRACLESAPHEQQAVFQALLGLEKALANPGAHGGLGLRKLHPSQVWEVRIGLSKRALFLLRDDETIFLLLGTHDEVKHFLRSL